MTFDWITKEIISPIFFFLCLVLTGLTAACLYAAFFKSTSFVVVGCLVFILAFNAFRVGWKLFHGTRDSRDVSHPAA